MILTIDNLDGLGAVDYSAAIDRAEPFEILRTLNAPSIAKGMLCLAGSTLPTPVRRARVIAASDAGTVLFSGYLATEPLAVYAGVASVGPVYRLAFSAISDEWLLDKQAAGTLTGAAFAGAGGAVVRGLLSSLDPALFSTAGVLDGQPVGVFVPRAGAAWSVQAGAAASSAYAAYRVLGGVVTMATAGTVTHTLDDGDGTLQIAGLRTAAVRELANDVTVSGAIEPTTYWTEIFMGDGTTAEFDLAGEPAAPAGGHAVLVADNFNAGIINLQRWAAIDPGSHLGLSGTGLTLNGGNGLDGQTTLASNTEIEAGGTVVAELTGVRLSAGSLGVLCGFYGGVIAQVNCLAGFSVKQSGGNTVVTPMIDGAETGSSATVLAGHSYTLRVRMHCQELLRVRQAFYARVDDAGLSQVDRFGGGLIDAPVSFVFELRDEAVSANTPMQVLFDGGVTTSYATFTFVMANSIGLLGSVGSVDVARTGTAWVRGSDPASGTVSTKLVGKLWQGVDCSVSSSVTGKVTFFPGRIPIPGEYVTVLYRGRGRAVARLADAASLAAEAAGGGVGTARWLGHVITPPARTTEDCEYAAQAVLAFATSRAAAVAGSYEAVNPQAEGDIWPGDVLALSENGVATNVVVRKVTIAEQGASPEALSYRIAFANDWAEGLGLTLSETIAADAVLPETPLELAPGQTPASPAHTLANPAQLAVIAFTGTGANEAITVDAGMDPPAGGGFEVRRRNGGFGSGGGDLVLRSPVRGFSIPRSAFEETFYVRMYDGSTPALYSRQSAGIVTHVPFG